MRLFALIFCLGVFLGFAGCGNAKPEDKAIEITQNLYNGEAKKVVEEIALQGKEDLTDEEKQMLNGKFEVMSASAKQNAQREGGVQEIKVLEVVFDENDSTRARVNIETTFKNGAKAKDRFDLMQVKGKWKLLLK